MNPKIKANKNIEVSAINSASSSFSGNTGLLIPIKISLSTSSSKLEKRGFLDGGISKSLKLPIKIFARDSNGVQVILENQENITTGMGFSLPE